MDKYIYVITVMERFNKEIDSKGNLLNVYVGSKRTVAVCNSYEEAARIIEDNIDDIWERSYDFACIEQIKLNEVYPFIITQNLFKYDGVVDKYYIISKEDYPTYSLCEIG